MKREGGEYENRFSFFFFLALQAQVYVDNDFTFFFFFFIFLIADENVFRLFLLFPTTASELRWDVSHHHDDYCYHYHYCYDCDRDSYYYSSRRAIPTLFLVVHISNSGLIADVPCFQVNVKKSGFLCFFSPFCFFFLNETNKEASKQTTKKKRKRRKTICVATQGRLHATADTSFFFFPYVFCYFFFFVV